MEMERKGEKRLTYLLIIPVKKKNTHHLAHNVWKKIGSNTSLKCTQNVAPAWVDASYF